MIIVLFFILVSQISLGILHILESGLEIYLNIWLGLYLLSLLNLAFNLSFQVSYQIFLELPKGAIELSKLWPTSSST